MIFLTLRTITFCQVWYQFCSNSVLGNFKKQVGCSDFRINMKVYRWIQQMDLGPFQFHNSMVVGIPNSNLVLADLIGFWQEGSWCLWLCNETSVTNWANCTKIWRKAFWFGDFHLTSSPNFYTLHFGLHNWALILPPSHSVPTSTKSGTPCMNWSTCTQNHTLAKWNGAGSR